MTNIPEFTVSQIARSIKMKIEDSFGYVKVKGEVSGFKKAASGHLYFTLKDEEALLNAVCFRGVAMSVDFDIEDGLMVDVSGKISTYMNRSCYQIIAEKLEPSGAGAIMAMLEKRKEKLAKEGLFDAKYKKDLPFFPKRIGVITSETGAVIKDIASTVEARCPTHIMLYNATVQGKTASMEVVAGLDYFASLAKDERPQVIIIARGGGSVEDLLPFSDEELVREVFKYDLPIISAIGHETDFCLLDFVADVRAPTPTGAAQMATIVLDEVRADVDGAYGRFIEAKERFFKQKSDEFAALARLIRSPKEVVAKMEERFGIFAKNIKMALNNLLSLRQIELNSVSLNREEIAQKILNKSQKVDSLNELIKIKIRGFFDYSYKNLENLSGLLSSRSHKEVLRRGFCMINDEKGSVISNIESLKIGQSLNIRGIGGVANVEVKKINLEK